MRELRCTWVPDTLDVVRLTGADRTLELKTGQLCLIFGRHALNDLYLKGRAVLQATPQQVALLA